MNDLLLRRNSARAAFFSALLLTAGLAACSSGGPDESDEPALAGTNWVLTAFEQADGARVRVDPPAHAGGRPYYSLAFGDASSAGNDQLPEGRALAVMGYPNSGSAVYETSAGGTLNIVLGATTDIAPPRDSREAAFLEALHAAVSYDLDGDRLRIAYGEGEAALRFEKADFSGE